MLGNRARLALVASKPSQSPSSATSTAARRTRGAIETTVSTAACHPGKHSAYVRRLWPRTASSLLRWLTPFGHPISRSCTVLRARSRRANASCVCDTAICGHSRTHPDRTQDPQGCWTLPIGAPRVEPAASHRLLTADPTTEKEHQTRLWHDYGRCRKANLSRGAASTTRGTPALEEKQQES
jgi:hypothetical protein